MIFMQNKLILPGFAPHLCLFSRINLWAKNYVYKIHWCSIASNIPCLSQEPNLK